MSDAVINDDWEVAVDTGEFDKQHEQQEKSRAAKQTYLTADSEKSNKPIRILKRPTSQTQLPVTNNSQPIIAILSNTSPSITPRIQTKDDILPSQSAKPSMKTYEQREAEYRLARLRIMGEEESSTKDDDDVPTESNEPVTNSTSSSLETHSNTSTIHFTPNTTSTGPYSQQPHRDLYSSPFSTPNTSQQLPPTSFRTPR